MAFFVIGGKLSCPLFLHVTHVARYLEHTLPNFKVRIIEKKAGEFEPWLETLNSRYKWHHVHSPIIWKELTMRGGIPHYVGGPGEFWEYCFHFYGLKSVESADTLEKLSKDHIQYLSRREKIIEEQSKRVKRIGIIQTHTPMLLIFLSELVKISTLYENGLLDIRIYDITLDYVTLKQTTQSLLKDVKNLVSEENVKCQVVEQVQEVINGCELLIIFGDLTRKRSENEIDWLVRNTSAMYFLADAINVYPSRCLKIIVATDGPVCFNVAVLIDTCPSVRLSNIVGITSDAGLGPLKCTAEQTGIPLSKLSGPPVWGYVGINEYVDLKSVVMEWDVHFPNRRALADNEGSTLPVGTIARELRLLCPSMDDDEEIFAEANRRRDEVKESLHRKLVYPKVRSLIDLIKEWYSKEETGNIISLGLCSNGSFGIPTGLVFSQPSILRGNVWKPYSEFPVAEDTQEKIQELIEDAERVNSMAGVGRSATFPKDFLSTSNAICCKK